MLILKEIGLFIQNQILGMKWLNELVGRGLSFVGFDINGRLGGSVQFFIYDSIKIFVLLAVLIFIVSYIQSYFPVERTKKLLGGLKGVKANILGALLGTVTPFCACSSIPIFMGFVGAGLSTGISFSFLISSPMVDIGSLVILMSIFGAKVALVYVFLGLVIAVLCGTIISGMKVEKYIDEFVFQIVGIESEYEEISNRDRIEFAKNQVKDISQRVYKYIIIGVAIGAIIHNWIPVEWIMKILGNENPFSVIIASLLGAPMYADIFGTIPVGEALLYKGVGLGTVLAFMMAVTTLSLPSMIMMSKIVKPKLLIIFISLVVTGIIVVGYLFNIFQSVII